MKLRKASAAVLLLSLAACDSLTAPLTGQAPVRVDSSCGTSAKHIKETIAAADSLTITVEECRSLDATFVSIPYVDVSVHVCVLSNDVVLLKNAINSYYCLRRS